MTSSDPDSELEAAFLRRLAKQLGVAEVSEEALATALGLDELTDAKLDRWFVVTMRRWLEDRDGPLREKVVQVEREATDRAEQPVERPALPAKWRPGARRRG